MKIIGAAGYVDQARFCPLLFDVDDDVTLKISLFGVPFLEQVESSTRCK